MSKNLTTMHGCACGRPGTAVARRDVVLKTRKWEVDVLHEDRGELHTNVITFGEPPVLDNGYRWVAP